MTVENLDTNQILVDENGKPTSYMEDYLFQIVEALGGEGSKTIITIIEEAIESGQFGRLKSSFVSLKSRVDDLENTEATFTNLSAIKKDIAEIEMQINTPINLKGIINRLDAIEAQL